MKKEILRLLVVDDSPSDTSVVVRALRDRGYSLKTQRVQDTHNLTSALRSSEWDLVVSEYALPECGASVVLEQVSQQKSDAPVVVFARDISDADLVDIMDRGAVDVVRKDQAARLALAIERELAVSRARRERRIADERRAEIENKHRAIIEGSRDAIAYVHDGMHVDANRAYLTTFGFSGMNELAGIPLLNLIARSHHARFKAYMRKHADADEAEEFVAVRQDGVEFPVEISLSPTTVNGEPCLQVIVNDLTERKAVESKLQYLNERDPVTGLYNRHYFLQELGKAVTLARAGGGMSALLYLDIDQLKNINDNLGHAAGDRALLGMARMLRETLEGRGLIARFGGDEFAILSGVGSEKDARLLAQQITKTLKKISFSEGEQTYRCNCSMSLTLVDETSESVQAVLSRAYIACEQSKTYKAATPAASAPESEEAASAEPPSAPASDADDAEWGSRLERALASDQIEVFYQPIVSLRGEVAECYEALARLSDTEGETVPAGDFIAAAARAGIVGEIDKRILDKAVETLALMRNDGRDVTLFVNLSLESMGDKQLFKSLQSQMKRLHVKFDSLVLEVDEAAVIGDPKQTSAFFKAARKLGCRVAIDNFGTGLGTFGYLRQGAIDFLKINGALMKDLVTDEVNQAAVQAMAKIAAVLGKKTVAKHVENAHSLTMLWNYGVDFVQGNYLQQPDRVLGYDFGGETTLSSEEPSAPSWAR